MKKTYLSPEIKIRRPRLRTHMVIGTPITGGISDDETDEDVFSKDRYDEYNDYDNNW